MKTVKNQKLLALCVLLGIVVLIGAFFVRSGTAVAIVLSVLLVAAVLLVAYTTQSKIVFRGTTVAMVVIAIMCGITHNTQAVDVVVDASAFTVKQLSITATADNTDSTVTGKDGTITVVAHGYTTKDDCGNNVTHTDTVTVTVKNITAATITYDLALSNVSGPTAGTGLTLESGASLVMTVESGAGDGNDTTGTITFSNVKSVSTGAQETTTFGYMTRGEAGATYSATFGGTYTVDGTAITAATPLTNASSHEYKLVATPAEGYTFAGWMSKRGGRLSTETSFPYTATEGNNDVVWPLFVKTGSTLYYIKGAEPIIYYGYMDDAIAAAGTNGTIVVSQSGSTYGTSGTEFTIPGGVTLLVPYIASDLTVHESTTTVEGKHHSTLKYANMKLVSAYNEGESAVRSGILLPDEDVTYTLTIPANTTLNVASTGKFVIGGTIAAGSRSNVGISCATSGKHSNVQLEGTLNVSGILSVCGYILGSGQVNVNSGGAVYQPFTIMDYLNGPYTIRAADDMTFPFYRYTMLNIQSNIHMVYGAIMSGYVDLYTTTVDIPLLGAVIERHNVTEFDVISSTGLIRLASGATLDISYDASRYCNDTDKSFRDICMYHRVGKTTLTFNGGMTFGMVDLTLTLNGSKYPINTGEDHFSIPYNFDIVLNSGTYQIPNMLKLLPGANMTINTGATLQITSGGSLGIMAGLRDHRTLDVTTDTNAWYLEHYPSTAVLQAAPFNGNGSANLIINGGTLQVDSGGSFGGLVQTTGTGTVVMNGTNTVQVRIGVQSEKNDALGSKVGRGLYDLVAQIYGIDGKLHTVQKGEYHAVNNNPYVVDKYYYKLYTDANRAYINTTQNMSQTLSATVIGTWQCKEDQHTYEKTSTTATCTAGGTATWTCSICGDSYTEPEAATGHSYTSEVTAPTCTAEGYTTYTCSGCGDTYTDNRVDATGHSYNEGVVTPPTCTAEGYTTYTCSICGHTYTDNKVSATGHSYTDTVTAPTCTEKGYTTHTCQGCGSSYKDTETAALGHDFSNEWSTDGSNHWHACSRCSEVSENAAHADTVTKDHMCDTCGYPMSTCSDVTSDKDHSCDICGKEGITEHSYTAVVTTQPTCTKEGVTTYTCNCGHTYTESVDATGHSYASEVTAPTCTAEGYTTYTCSGCGDTYTDNKVSATGHSYTSEVTAPTCTAEGYTTYTCSVCGDTYIEQISPTGQHTYEDNSVVCKVCGLFEFRASNIRLGNNLDMLFAFPDFKVDADLDGCYVEIVRTYYENGVAKTRTEEPIPYSKWGRTTVEGENCFYVIYSNFAAKDMLDQVAVTVYDSQSNALSTVWIDSIRLYSDRMLEKTDKEIQQLDLNNDGAADDSAKEARFKELQFLRILLADMLDYGAACQLFFNYNANDLANEDFGVTGKEGNFVLKGTSHTPSNDNFYGDTLIANSYSQFAVGFTSSVGFTYALEKNHWGNLVNYTIEASELKSATDETGKRFYYHGLLNLRIADARLTFTITVGEDSWDDSIESYCQRMIDKANKVLDGNNATDEAKEDAKKTIAVMNAFMHFSDAAYDYLHSQTTTQEG